jgi:hypothetical protein
MFGYNLRRRYFKDKKRERRRGMMNANHDKAYVSVPFALANLGIIQYNKLNDQ